MNQQRSADDIRSDRESRDARDAEVQARQDRLNAIPRDWVSFRASENRWVSESGKPVCQDHAAIMPCKFCSGAAI